MIGKFDRYLLTQLLMLFGFFALVLVLVYWVNRAVTLFDQLIANGQSALVFLELSALTLPNVVRIVLPIGAFAGTVYVANKLTSESELVVVQATGFSPWRLARPVLVFGAIVFVLSSILAHVLVPISLKQLSLRTAEISENLTARLLTEGRFIHPTEGVTFYIREISPQGALKNVFLSDSRFEGRRITYTAREALLIRGETGPSLIMIGGQAQVFEEDGKRLSVTRFDDFAYDLSGLVEIGDRDRLAPAFLGTPELLRAAATTQALTGADRAQLVSEAHERIGGTLNALFAPLIGFAALLLGGFSRFGVWRQILGAIVALIFIQILTRFGQGIVRGDADLWLAAYIGPLAGAALGFLLLAIAARPGLFRRRRPATAEGGL